MRTNRATMLLATIVVASLHAPAAAAPTYGASTSCGTSLLGQAAPTMVEEQCSSFRGSLDFKAEAAAASLGSRAGAIRGWPDGVPVGGSATSQFSDDGLLISWTGSGAAPAAYVPVRMRFDLDGAMEVLGFNGWAASHAAVEFSVNVPGNNSGYGGNFGAWVLRLAPEDNAVASNWGVLDGGFSHVGNTLLVDVTLQTAEFLVPVGTPFGLNMTLTAAVHTQHGGAPAGQTPPTHAAFSNFGNTATFAVGRDVFVLPEGYTANAGNYLVNNRFVPLQVPEPSPFALLLLGAAAIGAAARRRPASRQTGSMAAGAVEGGSIGCAALSPDR